MKLKLCDIASLVRRRRFDRRDGAVPPNRRPLLRDALATLRQANAIYQNAIYQLTSRSIVAWTKPPK